FYSAVSCGRTRLAAAMLLAPLLLLIACLLALGLLAGVVDLRRLVRGAVRLLGLLLLLPVLVALLAAAWQALSGAERAALLCLGPVVAFVAALVGTSFGRAVLAHTLGLLLYDALRSLFGLPFRGARRVRRGGRRGSR